LDINQRSKIFVDVASKLTLLANAKRSGKGSFTLKELKDKSKALEDQCLLVKLKDLRGYLLLCDGDVHAAAFQEPPALGERALALIGEDPLNVEIYTVPKDIVKEAETKLDLESEAQEVGQKLGEVLTKLSSKKKAKETTEEINVEALPSEEIEVVVPPLEVLELIDLVTMSDEIAYYLEREGVSAESDTPDSIDHIYVAKIKVNNIINMEDLIPKLYSATKKSEANSIIKVMDAEGRTYFFDPILHEGVKEVLARFKIYEEPVTYIELKDNKALINILLKSAMPPQYASRIVASLVNLVKRRKLPWKSIELKVRAGPMSIVGEVI